MRARRDWIWLDPTKHDQPAEVGFPSNPDVFFSPFDVPDGVSVTYEQEKFVIHLRYIAAEEPFASPPREVSGLQVQLGKHSGRVIALESRDDLPVQPEEILAKIRDINPTRPNSYIAKTALERCWPRLLERARRARKKAAAY